MCIGLLLHADTDTHTWKALVGFTYSFFCRIWVYCPHNVSSCFLFRWQLRCYIDNVEDKLFGEKPFQLNKTTCPVQVSQLEHCPIHQKAGGLIPGQDTYLGYRFNPSLGHVREATNWCFSLSSSVCKINKSTLAGEDLKTKIRVKRLSLMTVLLWAVITVLVSCWGPAFQWGGIWPCPS